MRSIGITSTFALALLLTATSPAWTQEQQEQKERPAQQEEKKAQPEQKAAKPEQKAAKPEQKAAKPEQKAAKPEQKPAAEQQKNAKPETKQQQNNNAKGKEKQAPQHAVQAQPAKQAQKGRGGSIPADRFKASFGQQHTFHVSQADYSRDRRFQYGGYSFGFVDAWPSNWLYTQDVYVIEIDGVYYLCNATYPGLNITLNIE